MRDFIDQIGFRHSPSSLPLTPPASLLRSRHPPATASVRCWQPPITFSNFRGCTQVTVLGRGRVRCQVLGLRSWALWKAPFLGFHLGAQGLRHRSGGLTPKPNTQDLTTENALRIQR